MARRILLPGPGDPEVLQLIQDDVPQPGPGEVRVRILAAGVARADTMMRRGEYPGAVPAYPYTPGYDMAGVVDGLGEGVDGLPVGTHVLGVIKTGGYAEYGCFPAEMLVPFPGTLDPAEVVSLGLNYLTAYQMLHRFAEIARGGRVLFHAAASGVGTAQLQLGKLLDLEMYGTASAGKHDIVTALGGVPIDYRTQDFVTRLRELSDAGMDAVFDPVGGSHLWRSFRTLRPGGKLIIYGEMAVTGSNAHLRREAFWAHNLPRWLNWLPGKRSATWYEVLDVAKAHPDWYRDDLALLIDLLSQGKLAPVIAERFPLAQAAQAHRLLERSAVSGKMILLCDQ